MLAVTDEEIQFFKNDVTEFSNIGQPGSIDTRGGGSGLNTIVVRCISQLYFILLIPSIFSFKKYLKNLSEEDLDFLDKIWPGHTTVLVEYNKNLPSHLCNDSGKIGLRVSNHLPIKKLMEGFKGFMISTSATRFTMSLKDL